MGDGDEITKVYMPPRDAIRRLSEVGVVHGLDDKTLDELRAECWDDDEDEMEDAGILGILTSFYEGVERGAKDGFLWRGAQFWNDTDDAVAEIAAVLKDDPPLYVQRSAREATAKGPTRQSVLELELRRRDGEIELVEARTLGDLVARFNAELKKQNDPRRLIALDTSGEWEMFVAIDLKLARKLVGEGVLPIADVDQLAG